MKKFQLSKCLMLNDKMTKWQNDKMTKWKNEKMKKWKNEKMKKCLMANDKMTNADEILSKDKKSNGMRQTQFGLCPIMAIGCFEKIDDRGIKSIKIDEQPKQWLAINFGFRGRSYKTFLM